MQKITKQKSAVTRRKIVSLLLSLAMILTALPLAGVTAFAAVSGDFKYTVLEDGTAEIRDYTSSAETLEIPSKLDTYTVTSIGANAFEDCDSLTSVTIPDSVTSIGYEAFYGCDSLTSVTIGNSVTSIGANAFEFCTNLTSVTIPDSVTSIGYEAFYWCNSLTSVTIPNSVTSIGDLAFSNCRSLEEIKVDANNKNYSSQDGVLFNKNKTELIDCPDGKTGAYKIPDSVTSIGDEAFKHCTSITSVTIPNSVTSIGEEAFYDCDSLTSVTIGNSVISIGDGAFAFCDSLTSITIPNSVTSIGAGPFSSCDGLTEIKVDANNKNYTSQDGVLFNKNKTELIQYPAGKSGASYDIPNGVTIIGNDAFLGCDSLTSVTIPESVTQIGSNAFAVCKSLTSVKIPGSVTSIGRYAFEDCDSLTSVTIPESVTSIGYGAFSRCESLTSVKIPGSVTSIGEHAFYRTGYYNNASNWKNGVLYIDDCLIDSNSDEIPENYMINAGTRVIADRAFYRCKGLTSVTIPNSVTSIGEYAFYNCEGLTSVTIPESVTQIGSNAFAFCKSLTSVIIGNGVTSIGEGAFWYCDRLADVYYPGSKEQWQKISIGSYNESLKNANIHYNSSGSYLPFHELYFENPVTVLNVGETKQLVVHSHDVSYVNGEFVYSNDQIVDNSEIVWNGYYYESNGVIKMSDSGQVTALKEGIEYVLVHSKDDISQGTSCRVFVGNPNEFNYTAAYDSKQYYAEGGFYSQVSSVSDCVEIYMLLENKLADALKDLTSVGGDPYGEEARAKFKNIAPITLTAKVSGNDLSFSRDSYTNTYTAKFDELSVGKSVDDVLMLFPRNININPNGNTYTVTVTLKSDSFETITEQYTFTVEDLETKNANEHISFAYGNPDYRVSKKNSYGETMRSLKDDWEYNFSRILSMDFENYYEIVFSDILIQMMNVDQLGNVSLLPVVKEWVGNYKTILSGVSKIVEDNYTGYLDVTENAIDKLLKKSKYTTDGMDVDDELRDFVVLKLRDKVSIDKVNSMFAAVDKTQQYFSYFKLSENITNDIADFIDGVSVLNSFQGMNDAFKDVIKQLYNKIPESENTLRDAVYRFVNLENNGGYTEEVLQDVALLAKNITEDAFKTMFKKQYISLICKYIGSMTTKSGALLSSTAAFSAISTGLGAAATGASLGVCLSDFLCNNSGKAEEMSRIVAMSEFSPYVIDTLNEYESKLYADRNDKAVDNFEYAFALHKATQSYIMEHTVKALETKRDTIIVKLFCRDDYDGLIADVLANKSVIDNLKCHNPNGESTVVTKTKVIAIKCPVDVFVYDESGQEVVRIKNDSAEYMAAGINYFVEGGEKYLALPAEQDYSIEIIATDNGKMEYTVTEYGDGGNRLKTVSKSNIELLDGRVFTGDIAEEMNASPESYALQYDENVILPNHTVTVPVTGVTVDKQNIELEVGESAALTATIAPANASIKSVSWVSDNPKVATVDENGKINAISSGVANITVTTNDWGYTDTCVVTVSGGHEHTDADGKWESNATQHFHTCECGAILDRENHSGGNATCTNKAICSVCGVEYGELNPENHTGETEIKNAVEATCDADGYTGDTYCKGCGTKIKDGDIIPASHRLTKVEAKEATDDAAGNIEYWVCSDCSKIFGDAEGKTEITLEETVISKALIGDVNEDGKVTVVDAKWILQHISGTRQLTEKQQKVADLNADGKITVVDAKWVLQIVSGLRKG